MVKSWHLARPLQAALLVLVLAAVGAAPAGAVEDPPPVTGQECRDVLVLGARGSGQAPDGEAADGFTGLGPQVYAVTTQLSTQLAGRRDVETKVLGYAAAHVVTLSNDPGLFFDSVDTGLYLALQTLLARQVYCASERIVLAGYSQGAMVMHRLLHVLAAGDSDPGYAAVLDRIDGAVLVADGDRVARDNVQSYGSAPRSATGVGHVFPALSSTSSDPFPATLNGIVHDICDRSDAVCDSRLRARQLLRDKAVSAPRFGYGVTVHLSYTPEHVQPAVTAIAERILRTAAPRPRQVTITADAGQLISHQLTADIPDTATAHWQVAPDDSLPAGVTMTTEGLLTGPMPSTGKVARVQVRAVTLDVEGDWADAWVQFDVTSTPPPPVDGPRLLDLSVVKEGRVITAVITSEGLKAAPNLNRDWGSGGVWFMCWGTEDPTAWVFSMSGGFGDEHLVAGTPEHGTWHVAFDLTEIASTLDGNCRPHEVGLHGADGTELYYNAADLSGFGDAYFFLPAGP